MGLLLLLELGCTGLATWLSEADFFIPAWAPPSAGGGAGAGPGLVGGVSATLDTRGTPTGPGAANIAGTQQTETFFSCQIAFFSRGDTQEFELRSIKPKKYIAG